MIGNNTVLGFFESILDEKKLEQLIRKFWGKIPSNDPEFFQNVEKDKKKNEIRYNTVEPHSLGRKVHEDKKVLKLENYLKENVERQTKRVINEIEEFAETNPKDKVETYLKLQNSKLKKIENKIEKSEIYDLLPSIKFSVGLIRERLNEIAQVYKIRFQENPSPSKAGRKPQKNDEFFVKEIKRILSEAKKDNPNSQYYHCIHRNEPHKPNYRDIANQLFEDNEELDDLYTIRGLQKRVKTIIKEYELN